MVTMYAACGLFLLTVYLPNGITNKTCPQRCHLCSKGECIQCEVGFWGEKCSMACKPHCKGNVCSLLSYCANGCDDGWYGFTCELECSHCNPGGCTRNDGYCMNGCLPKACHSRCPCDNEQLADNERGRKRYQTMDSIPNNLIVAFVIGVVFVVFIVFIFCGYTKCPEKNSEEACETGTNNCTSTRTRRLTLNRTRNSVNGQYSSSRRSDIAAYVHSNFPTAQRASYRTHLTSITAQPSRGSRARESRRETRESARENNSTSYGAREGSRRDVMLNLTFCPPPYGSLTPPGSPKEPKVKTTPPPTYDSLFPPKYLPESS